MDIKLRTTGTEQVQVMLAALGGAPARQAVQRWSNWIGLEAQGEMRKQIPTRFSMRGTGDGFKQAIVFSSAQMRGDRAMKAELKVGGPGFGQSRTQKLGAILARHEDGGERRSSSSVRLSTGQTMDVGFFIPSSKFRTSTTNPPRALYPKNIGAALYRRPDGSFSFNSSVKKTRKRKGEVQLGATFFVTEKGIFRWKHDFSSTVNRKGQSWSDRAEPVWWFAKRIRTAPRLRLWDTAERVFEVRAVALGLQAIEETIFRQSLR